MPDWSEIRAEFPLVTEDVYLDTASTSPTPGFVADGVDDFFREKARGYLSKGWREAERECRGLLADYLGVDEDCFVFLSNTTEGINAVASSMDWEAGDEVVLSDVNFPSNVYPWINLRDRGVEVNVAATDDGALTVDAVESEITDDTRLLSLPHVSSLTGHRIDLSEFGELAREHDAFLNVDGIQALGYCRPDLEDVDGYQAATFKWLLGPFGLGISYFDEEAVAEMDPSYVGYGSVTHGPEYRYDDFELKSGPQKFQYAHANYPAIYCLNRVLSFLDEVGVENVHRRVVDLSGYMIDELAALDGVSVVTDRNHRGGIVVFSKRGLDAGRAERRLAEDGVHVAARGENLRASVHFYNERSDVEALVEAVADL